MRTTPVLVVTSLLAVAVFAATSEGSTAEDPLGDGGADVGLAAVTSVSVSASSVTTVTASTVATTTTSSASGRTVVE